jgi:hypothetical protein
MTEIFATPSRSSEERADSTPISTVLDPDRARRAEA